MTDKVPLTIKGKENIEKELKELKEVQRPLVISQIATARDHGDLKENAEYHAARDKQSFLEGRILDLEDKLARAEVIDPSKIQSDKVLFSAYVHLLDEEGDKKLYQIVGEPEADINQGLIAVTSPIARALIGKEEGDEVKVKTPKGEAFYEIVKVEYK